MVKSENGNKKSRRRIPILTVALILSLTFVLGTAAFIIDKTHRVENTFNPSRLSCEVEEKFDGEVKRNVNVRNSSDIAVYVRLKLITYRVNGNNEMIGGTAELPDFTPADGWFLKDGVYYYSMPVSPDSEPAAPLIGDDGIRLMKYTDADGGKQAVEVMAEAIQAEPAQAVRDAWGVNVSADGRIFQ